jgi:hypothetical protein
MKRQVLNPARRYSRTVVTKQEKILTSWNLSSGQSDDTQLPEGMCDTIAVLLSSRKKNKG